MLNNTGGSIREIGRSIYDFGAGVYNEGKIFYVNRIDPKYRFVKRQYGDANEKIFGVIKKKLGELIGKTSDGKISCYYLNYDSKTKRYSIVNPFTSQLARDYGSTDSNDKIFNGHIQTFNMLKMDDNTKHTITKHVKQGYTDYSNDWHKKKEDVKGGYENGSKDLHGGDFSIAPSLFFPGYVPDVLVELYLDSNWFMLKKEEIEQLNNIYILLEKTYDIRGGEYNHECVITNDNIDEFLNGQKYYGMMKYALEGGKTTKYRKKTKKSKTIKKQRKIKKTKKNQKNKEKSKNPKTG